MAIRYGRSRWEEQRASANEKRLHPPERKKTNGPIADEEPSLSTKSKSRRRRKFSPYQIPRLRPYVGLIYMVSPAPPDARSVWPPGVVVCGCRGANDNTARATCVFCFATMCICRAFCVANVSSRICLRSVRSINRIRFERNSEQRTQLKRIVSRAQIAQCRAHCSVQYCNRTRPCYRRYLELSRINLTQ